MVWSQIGVGVACIGISLSFFWMGTLALRRHEDPSDESMMFCLLS